MRFLIAGVLVGLHILVVEVVAETDQVVAIYHLLLEGEEQEDILDLEVRAIAVLMGLLEPAEVEAEEQVNQQLHILVEVEAEE